jgi:hypothetical protein
MMIKEHIMKSKKSIFFGLFSFLVLLSLAACSGTNSDQFPTGRFSNEKFINNEYVFNSDNSWVYYSGGSIGAQGTYQVDGNLWTEAGTSGECPFPATYEWTFDGKLLSFKLSGEDNCVPRREATDGQTFVLKK